MRLNYKFVTKSCVFTDNLNQNNFHFSDNKMLLFISDKLFLCLTFPKYNLSISIVQFLKVLDSTVFVHRCLVTCNLLRVTEHHCCKAAWQQESTCCSICLLYRLCYQANVLPTELCRLDVYKKLLRLAPIHQRGLLLALIRGSFKSYCISYIPLNRIFYLLDNSTRLSPRAIPSK